MSVCAAQRNKRSISSPTKSLKKTTTTMTMMMRTKNPYPRTIHHPLVRRTPTSPLEDAPAAVDSLNRVLLTLSPPQASVPVRSTPPGGFGSADGLRLQPAGGHFTPSGAGRHHPEPSPRAVRATLPAAVSPLAWSCPHPSTASLPGLSFPHPADTSHLLLKEDHLPSDPFHLFNLFHPAATDHQKLGRLPHRLGCNTGQLDICRGRVPVPGRVMLNW